MGLYSMQGQPHQQQGEQTTQQTSFSRPASVVQPQHAQTPQSQHNPGYPSTHSISSVYQPSGNQSAPSHQPSDGLPYYTHTAYNATGATSGYPSAGASCPFIAMVPIDVFWNPPPHVNPFHHHRHYP